MGNTLYVCYVYSIKQAELQFPALAAGLRICNVGSKAFQCSAAGLLQLAGCSNSRWW